MYFFFFSVLSFHIFVNQNSAYCSSQYSLQIKNTLLCLVYYYINKLHNVLYYNITTLHFAPHLVTFYYHYSVQVSNECIIDINNYYACLHSVCIIYCSAAYWYYYDPYRGQIKHAVMAIDKSELKLIQ